MDSCAHVVRVDGTVVAFKEGAGQLTHAEGAIEPDGGGLGGVETGVLGPISTSVSLSKENEPDTSTCIAS